MADLAPRGKIGSFPAEIREELNQRLHDGQRGPQLLPWLNGLPAVAKILEAEWQGEPVTDQNLSAWRTGQYARWVRRREKIEHTQQLAGFCRKLAEAGGDALHLPAAMAGGQIMEVLEDFDPDALRVLLAEKPESYLDLLRTVASLQSAQTATKRAGLEAKKFERTTAEMFIDYVADEEAKRIALSNDSREVKIDQLLLRMFGKKPETLGPGGGRG